VSLRAAGALLALLLPVASAWAEPDLSSDALLRDHFWRELTALPPGKRPTVGLALSAGSLRATAHIGVISVLENAGFPIDVVSGTSMGAVLGALYAGGIPAGKLWTIGATIKWNLAGNVNAFSLFTLFLSDKLLSSKKGESFIQRHIGDKQFDELQKPFACVAMDLYSGEEIIFREGNVALAVRASMNVPGFFEPVEYRHRYLVDGGVVDYIPVDAARLLGADWTLASVTESDYIYSKPKNVFESLNQVIDIRGSLLSHAEREKADFLIEPPLGDIGMFDAHRIPEAMEKGVIVANKKLRAAEESLILYSLSSLVPEAARP